MKKLVLTCVVSLSTLWTIALKAQSFESADDIYSHYSSMKGVMAMTFNKTMLDAVDMDFDWDNQMKHISGDIYELQFVSMDREHNSPTHIRDINTALSKLALREINIPKEKGETDLRYLKIYGDKQGDYYRNIYMLILTDGNTGIFVSVNGKLRVNPKS